MSDSAEESEFPKHEKTEEEKERLREERRLRRTKKKYEAKAEKRGMTVEQYLKVKSTAPEPKKTAKSPSTHKSNPKKRAREEETPKVRATSMAPFPRQSGAFYSDICSSFSLNWLLL